MRSTYREHRLLLNPAFDILEYLSKRSCQPDLGRLDSAAAIIPRTPFSHIDPGRVRELVPDSKQYPWPFAAQIIGLPQEPLKSNRMATSNPQIGLSEPMGCDGFHINVPSCCF